MLNLLLAEDLAGGAVEAVGHGLPVGGEVDHVASVKHAVAEQMVKLEAGPVDRPVVFAVRVVQVVALRRQHGQVLDVAPRQQGAEDSRSGWFNKGQGHVCTVSCI